MESFLIVALLLILPIYFISRFLFRRISAERSRVIVTWLSTLVLAPIFSLIIVVGWFFVTVIYFPYHARDFDSTRWKAYPEKRYEMTDDITLHDKLKGKTKREIIELLGQEENDPKSDLWQYDVGIRPLINNVDVDVLEIQFENEIVVATNCYNH